MMRILEVLGEPISNGGQESYIMNFLNHTKIENCVIDTLTPYYCENEYYRQVVGEKGGTVYVLQKKFNPGGLRINILGKINKFFRDNRYDIVHVHSGSVSVLALVALSCHIYGIKNVIVHSHSSGKKENIKHLMAKLLANLIFSKCVWQYCACSIEAAKWKFTAKTVDEKTVILKNGINIDKYRYNPDVRKRVRKELDIKENVMIIGHVGRFTEEKNHIFLINLFAQLLYKRNDACLLLLGDGEDINVCKQIVSKRNLENKVIFLGRVNEVEKYLQAMDVFVFPSIYEGLGISCIEAQAASLPVVMSDGAPLEVKLSDNTIRLSLADSAECWVDSILEVYEKYERKDNSIRVKNAGYDIDSTVNKLEEIYMSATLLLKV